MATPATPTAAYQAALVALQKQQRARLTLLIQQTEGALHRDWQAGPALAAQLYRPVLDEYAKALADLRLSQDDPAAKLAVSWLSEQNAQLRGIEASVQASMTNYAGQAARTVEEAQNAALARGTLDASHLTQEALFPASRVGVNPDVLFSRPNPDALALWVGRAGNGHPLGDLFANFPAEATSEARKAMLFGLATGANPKAMADGISQAMGISRSRAIIISRTEVLTAYRAAAHETYRANSDVLAGWLWSAGGNNPCFPAGTLIRTRRGQVAIEDVVVGDEVLTHRGQYRFFRVTETMRRTYLGPMVVIYAGGHQVTATPEHPFWVERMDGREWVEAGALLIGDRVVRKHPLGVATRSVAIDNITVTLDGLRSRFVYNLEVETDHTYLANDFVVHNCAMCMGMDGTFHGLWEDLSDHPCFPAGMLVSGPRALGSTTRWYEGDLIDITTRDGRFLSVTPNHPILTPQGWIMAGLLKEGDDVVCHDLGERGHTSPVGTPDDYQVPAPIEQIASAFGRASDMTPVPVPLAAEDLDGERRVGVNRQVNVVRPNGILRHAGNGRKARRQPFPKQHLPRRDADLTLLTSLGAAYLLPQRLSLAALAGLRRQHDTSILLRGTFSGIRAGHGRRISTLNASSRQPLADGGTRDAELSSKPLLGLSSLIASDDLRIRQTLLGPLRHSITPADEAIAQLTVTEQSANLERIREALLTNMEPRSNDLSAIPGDIRLDRVLKISVRRFSGHVYNLQTSTGWYVTNSIITHNCGKCSPLPVTKDWSEIFANHGFGDIDTSELGDTRITRTYVSGEERFRTMSAAQQERIIGTRTGYEAYRRGELELRDFTGVKPPENGFPAQYYQKSLRELQIPTRQGRLVEPSQAIAGAHRAVERGRVTPLSEMPKWARQSPARENVYQILRNGLPYNMAEHERPLLLMNLEQMLAEADLPANVRAAAEKLYEAMRAEEQRLATSVWHSMPGGGRADAPARRVATELAAKEAVSSTRTVMSAAEAEAKVELKAARSSVNSLARKLDKVTTAGKDTTTLSRDLEAAQVRLAVAQIKVDAEVAARKAAQAAAKEVEKQARAAERAAARDAAKQAKVAEREAAKAQRAKLTGKPDVKPEAQFVKLVHANQKGDIAWFADLHNMTVAEYEKAVNAKLAQMIDQSVISVREPQSALEQILDAGRFKTVHESGSTLTSSGQRQWALNETEEAFRAKVGLYADIRAQYEKEAFGYALYLPVELRPVSGYIAPLTEDDAAARGFGEARLVLKDEVRARSTFTVGDSLQNTNAIPEPVNAPKYDAFIFQNGKAQGFDRARWAELNDPLNPKAFGQNIPLSYMEAQIHGGVQASDIAEVVFNTGANPSEALIAKLDAARIPWRMESGEAISAEKAAAQAEARVIGEYYAKLDRYHQALDQADPAVKQYLKDAASLRKARANENVAHAEVKKAEAVVERLAAQGKQATTEYRDAKAAYDAAQAAQQKTYKSVNQAIKNLRTRSPGVYKAELDSVGGLEWKLEEMGLRVESPASDAAFATSRATEGATEGTTREAIARYGLTVSDKRFVNDLKQQIIRLDQHNLTHDQALDIGGQINSRIIHDPTLAVYQQAAEDALAIRNVHEFSDLTADQLAWVRGDPDAVAAHGGIQRLGAVAQYQAEYQARALSYLQEVREMGGADLRLDTAAAKFDERAAQTLLSVQDQLPRDWIVASNDYGDLAVERLTSRNYGGWYQPSMGTDGNGVMALPVSSRANPIDQQSVALHEFMHRMEDVLPQIGRLEEAYYNSRTAGEAFVDLTNGIRDKTKLDQWMDEYLGRAPHINRGPTYLDPNGLDVGYRLSYELLSMGAEALYGGGSTYDLIALREDEDFMNFVLGLLSIVRADAGVGAIP